MFGKSILKKSFWALSSSDVLSDLEVSKQGLSSSSVKERLSVFGPNRLPEKRRLNKLTIFLNQLKSPLIFILIIAGLVTLGLKELKDAVVIFSAVFINSFLGFYQENKAENALINLKTLIRDRALVVRQGRDQEVETADLVPGDIIKIFHGERIPADARLLSANDLSVDEAILTGESLPVKKSSSSVNEEYGLGDRSSMVWSGTFVVEGSGLAVVTATGPYTELGRIATLVRESQETLTPLQKAINEFTIKLGIILVALVALLFGTGIYLGQDIFEMFITSVAVAVSAIPEGLPIALTVILAIGVQRMAAKKGVVRKLLAAETLGSATIILTDKTGTLTESQTKLSQVFPVSNKISPAAILELAALNSDAVIPDGSHKGSKKIVIGRPLEVSLINGLDKFKLSLSKIRRKFNVVKRFSFNSKEKFSGAIIAKGKKFQISLLGAPDILLGKSGLDDSAKDEILSLIDERAFAGEKLIGLAVKDIDDPEKFSFGNPKHISGLNFLGLISFTDPVRPSVKDSIAKASRLGVKTVIVTGDYQGTAASVAKQVGLNGNSKIVVGSELDRLTDEQLKKRLPEVSIFARVTPEQKLRIVRIYQESKEVVAMTGDGINDAPALKEADIGIAVGSGTEVAKGASDLVILDDNFTTIVAAITEGRRTLGNIKKVIVYLLSSIVDELALIGGALLFGLAIPLNALQILWVNFFSDSFPALGLAFEHQSSDLGKKPNRLSDNLMDPEMKFLIMVIGVLSSLFLFIMYYVLLKLGFNLELVRTFIFASFGLYSLILVFSIRNLKQSILTYNIFDNNYLSAGVGVGVIMMIFAIYFPPLQSVLDTVSLSPIWISGVILVGLLNIIAVEFGKWLYRSQI